MNLNWYGRTVTTIDDSGLSAAEIDAETYRYAIAGIIVGRRFKMSRTLPKRVPRWLREVPA